MAKASAQYWLVKSEPEVYAYAQLEKDGGTRWDGVRNYQARIYLRAMRKGDLVLYYHSQTDKAVVGVAVVAREHYADPTAEEGDWSCVDLAPKKALKKPVSLETLKSTPALAELLLIKQSRLSVMPVTKDHFERITKLGG